MKNNKTLKVLSTTALLASVAAPFGTGVVSANSTNFVQSVKNVESDYNSNGAIDTALTTLTVKEDDTGITSNDTFRVILPAGVEWDDDDVATSGSFVSATGTVQATYVKLSDQVIEVTPNSATFDNAGAVGTDTLAIPLYVKFDGPTAGEQKVTIDPLDGTVTGGQYTFAVVGSGSTKAVVDSVKNIGKGVSQAGTIRIDETAIGAVGVAPGASQVLKVKLPPNFEWSTANLASTSANDNMEAGSAGAFTNVTSGGGFGAQAIRNVNVADDRTLEITLEPQTGDATRDANKRGSIYITPFVKADSDAQYGEVTASISGGDFTDEDVTIAKYSNYNAGIKIDAVKELLAGKVDDLDTKTGKVTIEEAAPGSFIAGRDLTLELPTWVKVVGVTDTSETGFTDVSYDIKQGTDNKVIITPESTTSGTTGKIEFKLQLSIQADKAGDIEATLNGSGIQEQKLVIAKAKAPVSAEAVQPSKLKIGVQSQEVPDIILTEALKGAFEENTETFTSSTDTAGSDLRADVSAGVSNGQIRLLLPAGVTFAAAPKVEVLEGNLELDTDNITRGQTYYNYDTVVIPVKSEGTKPSKIKVSGVKLTVDRTVPEGPIGMKVAGSALVENSGSGAGRFNAGSVLTFQVADTITPAPGDTTATNIVFKLNSKTFTVDGKEMEMDAAPLVGWDRAYLPVRFAANALNVSDDQIIWDDKTSTFTVFKGDRVVSGKVGDKFLTVNGAKVPMDVPVWRNKAQTNNRVMVPIRYLSNALNANIEWNKETSEITIQAQK